jgi:hypothetical protein
MCFFKRKKKGGADKLTADSKLSALLDNPQAKAILEKHIPENINDPRLKKAVRFISLRKLFSAAGDRIDQSKLPLIEEDLKKLFGE